MAVFWDARRGRRVAQYRCGMGDGARQTRTWLDYVRWALIVVILVWGFVGSVNGSFESCSEQATEAGVVEVCGPPAVTDLSVVSALALILFLAAPDISEASLGGVVSIKRRLARAEEQVRQQAQDLHSLRMAIDVRLATHAASASAAENNVFIVTSDQLASLPEAIERKWRGEPPPAQPPPTGPGDDYAADVLRLINNWEQLNELVPLRPQRGATGVSPDDEREEYKRSAFVSLFKEEIQLVRAARNSVAHSQPLPPEAVREAADAAEELLRIFQLPFPSEASRF
jgi:hypothetical protein